MKGMEDFFPRQTPTHCKTRFSGPRTLAEAVDRTPGESDEPTNG